MNFDYDFPDDWEHFTTEEKTAFYTEARGRWMWYMFKQAEYERDRTERVSSFKVDEPLE